MFFLSVAYTIDRTGLASLVPTKVYDFILFVTYNYKIIFSPTLNKDFVYLATAWLVRIKLHFAKYF